MEILAPVGGQQQLIAAVRCGANAVYLGAKGFNARRNAENFDSLSLAETVSYCHSHGVKVHVTLNTLIHDSELEQLYKTADEIAESGADAVIVQDMAVINYLRTRYPELALHASTQTVVHNVDGARFMEDIGCSRVVLARELSLEEIRKISQSVSIETEVFVHGALCMCLSGACYMSAMIGGRSGNRGLCAQPCRLNFTSGKRQYALSLKDMSHIKHIDDLEKAGVCSLKIEGRMKRPEYVAAAVSACKAAMKGEAYDEETLRAVFSRGGFTDGYITGVRDLSMFGHREKDDVTAAAKVFKTIENTYHKENPLLKVDMELDVRGGEPCVLKASCLDKKVTVLSDTPAEPSRVRDTDETEASKYLSRLGGTQFYLGALSVDKAEGYTVPPSVLNSMRRDAVQRLQDALGEKRAYVKREITDEPLPAVRKTESPKLWARFLKSSQISRTDGYEKIIVPVSEILKAPDMAGRLGDKLIAELPAAAFPEFEDRIDHDVERVKALGVGAIYTENAYGVELGRRLSMDIYGGAGLNILNSRAAQFYAGLGLKGETLSFELAMSKAESLRTDAKKGVIGYGYLPLMTVRNCPVKSEKGCGGCHGDRYLTDRLGERFPVFCRDRMYSTVFNCLPLNIADKKVRDLDYVLLYFTMESRSECEQVYDDYVNHSCGSGRKTAGLYYRTLA